MSNYTKDILEILGNMDIDLDLDSIDVNKSLLEQGLDSLDMMDLYFNLEEKFNKKIEFDSDSTQHRQWASVKDIAEGLKAL